MNDRVVFKRLRKNEPQRSHARNMILGMQPLESGSLSVRAYNTIKEGLISGSFRPGQRLVMQQLAEALGTSITPVREACLRLVSEGSLEMRSGRFAAVPALTLERYTEVRTIRLSLEGLATSLAAENAGQQDIEVLERLQDEFERVDGKGDSTEAQICNRDFHFGVYRLSNMTMLVSHIESLWASMGPMLTVFYNEGEHHYVGAHEHRNVIAAIRARDSEQAEEAMRNDIILGGEDFLRFLKVHKRFSVE